MKSIDLKGDGKVTRVATGGRVHFAYTVKPDDGAHQREDLLARQDQVRETARQMGLGFADDEVAGDGDVPFLDLHVSVPDELICPWVQATRDDPPTSDVLCENLLQWLALGMLGLGAQVYLSAERESWEHPRHGGDPTR